MSSGFSKNAVKIMALIACLICFLVYVRALSCDFVNWDDGEYVYDNPIIRSFNKEFVVKVFTSSPLNFWIPLTWVSFAVDYQLWGMNPLGYHLTNIILHAVNAGIVVLVADRLWKQWQSASGYVKRLESGSESYLYLAMLLFAALIWGIHPARVESVAWITERKDVLNGLFTFSSILFYLRYVQKKEALLGKNAVYRDYVISLLLFLLSMMSKPTSVLLPLMLLVIDWYPMGRLHKSKIVSIVLEKVPYLLLGLAVSAVTVRMNEQISAYIPLRLFPLDARVVVIGNSLFEYFKFMINPVGILPYHHLPMHIPQIFILKTIAIVFFLCCCLYVGMKKKWVSAIIISFIIPLLPVLQFFPNGFQPALCLRYTYLASLFPCLIMSGLALVWLQKTVENSRYFAVSKMALSFLLIFYVVVTQSHIGDWKNSETFWSKVIAYQPFDRAYYYRALYYVDAEKKYNAAVADYTTCLEMFNEDKNPEIFNLYAFRGEALAKAGYFPEAIKDFDAAISLFPHKLYYFHRGMVLKELGKIKEAKQDLLEAGNAEGRLRWIPAGSSLQ